MHVQESIPSTLECATPEPRLSLGHLLARYAPTGLWIIALVLYPVAALWILPSTRRTSGSNNPHIYAMQWALAAIAVRAAIALARRNRSWWSLAYIALYVILPVVADRTAKWWWSTW